MNKTNLKKVLNALVDSIKDKQVLYDLEKDVFPYVIKNRTKKKDNEESELTEEQKLELEESLREADNGNTITMEEFEDEMENFIQDSKPGLKRAEKKKRRKLKRVHAGN